MADDDEPLTPQQKPRPTQGFAGSVRAMLLKSLDDLGGVDYLKTLAMTEPRAYASLVAKLIPQVNEVTGGDGGPVVIYFPPL